MADRNTQKQLDRARKLIKRKKFEQARDILTGLDDPAAQKWLDQIDELDSPFSDLKKKRSGGPGCLKIGLGVGCVAPIAALVGVVVIVAIVVSMISAGEEASTKDAVSANDGRGTLDNPISPRQPMVFDAGEVRATRLVRPADAMIEDFNMYNDAPAAGTEYALVWYEVECGEEECDAALDLSFALVDSDGKEWGEELFLVLSNDLDDEEAIRGGVMSGWQVFEIAKGKSIEALKVKFGTATLYAAPPSAT